MNIMNLSEDINAVASFTGLVILSVCAIFLMSAVIFLFMEWSVKRLKYFKYLWEYVVRRKDFEKWYHNETKNKK